MEWDISAVMRLESRILGSGWVKGARIGLISQKIMTGVDKSVSEAESMWALFLCGLVVWEELVLGD
jgi:predicted small integral membrane protein